MPISTLELRHIIESGFLPLECRCSLTSDQELIIELVDPATAVNLVTGGIPVARLNSSRAIAELIGSLRSELFAQQAPQRHKLA